MFAGEAKADAVVTLGTPFSAAPGVAFEDIIFAKNARQIEPDQSFSSLAVAGAGIGAQ